MSHPAPVYIGIDFSQAHLDVAGTRQAQIERWPNRPQAWAKLVRLHWLVSARVVLEATGGYERGVAMTLAAAGLPGCAVNSRQVRQ
jgi:transposase